MSERSPIPDRLGGGVATDLLARAIVIVLFSLMSANLFSDFLRTGHVTGLLLLASESLVVVLTIVRRRTSLVDRSAAGVITTAVSLAGPPLLRAFDGSNLVPDAVTAGASAVGLGLVIVGKLALGRSFGIAPANRGVVMRGPYVLVRHPIYAGYLLTHAAFLVAHLTPWNVAVVIVADGALVVRALIEERVLSADAQYQSYCRKVGWHLVPGVF
jgi:protein-S-isoprenylcysteine O-methyltransferase Ste14